MRLQSSNAVISPSGADVNKSDLHLNPFGLPTVGLSDAFLGRYARTTLD